MQTQRLNLAPIAAGILTFVGMCLPWAHVGRMSVSGWHGSANFMGVPCPGFLVAIVAGVAVASLSVRSDRKSSDQAGKHTWLPLLMCAYGILHSGFMALALTATRGMSVGIGIPVTLLAFGGIVFCIFQPAPDGREVGID